MSKPKPIRIIVPKLDMSRHDQNVHRSSYPSTTPSRHTHRTHVSSGRAETRHRHDHPPSQVASPIPGTLSPPILVGRGRTDPPHTPPFRSSPSPGAEPELLPGGGVQIPPGFHLSSEADRGHYRPQEFEDGDPENARVLGRMGLGVFRGLRKIPAAIVKAGRSYGPRIQENQPDMSPVPETDHETDTRAPQRPGQSLREALPNQDEVETYVEPGPDDEESHAREEQLLHEYIQRKRMSRDRAFRKRSRRERYLRPVPPPQPVPLPGSHTPAASVVASQVAHSQAGHSEGHQTSPEARLEAEEMRREREELEQAQARERARHVYAADVVRQPPSSSLSSDQPYVVHESQINRNPGPPRKHRRPSTHVLSRWSAERDIAGRRRENHRDGDTIISSLGTGILRFIQYIRDLPWVGDRVAADYIPGGSKRTVIPSHYFTSSPVSGTPFSSPPISSGSGSGSFPLPVHGIQALPRPNIPGKSWYAIPENVLVLPPGVEPPPGFVPYPFPVPQLSHSTPSADGQGPNPPQSHTNIEALPAALRATGPDSSNPEHLRDEASHYMPGETSYAGQPIFVPMANGRHQPMVIPGTQPAFGYPNPVPPNFVPPPG